MKIVAHRHAFHSPKETRPPGGLALAEIISEQLAHVFGKRDTECRCLDLCAALQIRSPW